MKNRKVVISWIQLYPAYNHFRVLTKYRKNEALIRNDGVYVISGIFCRANACEKVKARRAEVPSTRSAQARNTAQAKRRAVRNGKMHSRPGLCPLEAAKRLEARAHAVRRQRPRSGWRREDTPKRRPQRRNTAPPKARAVRRHGTPRKRQRRAVRRRRATMLN